MYSYDNSDGNHCTTTIDNIVGNYPKWTLLGVLRYIYKKRQPETIPLCLHYNDTYFDHHTTTDSHIVENYPNWELLQTSEYIFPAD